MTDPRIDAPGTSKDEWILRLYVTGKSPKCLRAIQNLERICEEYLAGKYRIELVDLVANPRLARGDQIVAVPTLVKRIPQPMRQIIGDLSDTESVLVGLDIKSVRESS